MQFRHKLLAAAALLCLPFAAQAESTFSSGTGSPLTASARVDFTITVPKILFLQVGTGTNMAANAKAKTARTSRIRRFASFISSGRDSRGSRA